MATFAAVASQDAWHCNPAPLHPCVHGFNERRQHQVLCGVALRSVVLNYFYTNDSTVVCSAAQVTLFDGRNW
jgi:hypothetical protein